MERETNMTKLIIKMYDKKTKRQVRGCKVTLSYLQTSAAIKAIKDLDKKLSKQYHYFKYEIEEVA